MCTALSLSTCQMERAAMMKIVLKSCMLRRILSCCLIEKSSEGLQCMEGFWGCSVEKDLKGYCVEKNFGGPLFWGGFVACHAEKVLWCFSVGKDSEVPQCSQEFWGASVLNLRGCRTWEDSKGLPCWEGFSGPAMLRRMLATAVWEGFWGAAMLGSTWGAAMLRRILRVWGV